MNILIVLAVIIIGLVVWGRINGRGITQVNVKDALEMLKDSGVTMLDVRSPQEFQNGHIEGAKLIPLPEISNRIDELASDKDRQILTYCYAGSRSMAANRVLRRNGFTKIFNLRGGITAWINQGNKTIKGK